MDRQTESGMDKQADTKKDRKTNGRTRTEWTTDGRTQKYILVRKNKKGTELTFLLLT